MGDLVSQADLDALFGIVSESPKEEQTEKRDLKSELDDLMKVQEVREEPAVPKSEVLSQDDIDKLLQEYLK